MDCNDRPGSSPVRPRPAGVVGARQPIVPLINGQNGLYYEPGQRPQARVVRSTHSPQEGLLPPSDAGPLEESVHRGQQELYRDGGEGERCALKNGLLVLQWDQRSVVDAAREAPRCHSYRTELVY